MYSEHKHPGEEASTALGSGRSLCRLGVDACARTIDGTTTARLDTRRRSVTVDTSAGWCAEWAPGRGSLLTVSPLRIGQSVSTPVDTDRGADDAAVGRSAQVVASA